MLGVHDIYIYASIICKMSQNHDGNLSMFGTKLDTSDYHALIHSMVSSQVTWQGHSSNVISSLLEINISNFSFSESTFFTDLGFNFSVLLSD